jgi:hypothetical protein
MKNNLFVSILKCSLMMIKGNIFFGVSPCFIFFIQYGVCVYMLFMFFPIISLTLVNATPTMNVILGTVLLIQAFFIKQLRSFSAISSYVYAFASTNNTNHRRSFSKNKEFENVSPS